MGICTYAKFIIFFISSNSLDQHFHFLYIYPICCFVFPTSFQLIKILLHKPSYRNIWNFSCCLTTDFLGNIRQQNWVKSDISDVYTGHSGFILVFFFNKIVGFFYWPFYLMVLFTFIFFCYCQLMLIKKHGRWLINESRIHVEVLLFNPTLWFITIDNLIK